MLSVRVAAAAAGAILHCEEVPQLVTHHGEQPTAEGAAPRIVIETADAAGDRLQNVLRQVGSVGVLESVLVREAVDQRRIDFDELRPGRVIAGVAQADQETEPGRWRIAHAASPPYYKYRRPAKPY